MPRVKLFDENEVLNKAMVLFWKQGYAATSVQDLVSNLGINRASLYDTFGDKEKLFKRAFDHYREINIKGLTAFLNNQQDAREAFATLFQNAIDESITDKDRKGCFVVNVTTELVPHDEKITAVVEENKNKIVTVFYEFLAKCRDEGQLQNNQDLQSVALLLYTVYAGLKVVSKVKPNKREMTDALNIALSLLN